MPLTGGPSRPFLGEGTTTPSWSPDGTRLAYITVFGRWPRFAVDRRRQRARMPGRSCRLEREMHNHNPVWSPDGQWIYFTGGLDPNEAMDVWRVRPAGGPPERISRKSAAVTFLAPLGSRTLLYVARAEDRSGPWLWSLDVETGVARRASVGLEQYTSVAASRDGRRVVATVANPTASLWRVPLGDRRRRRARRRALPGGHGAGAGATLRRDVLVPPVHGRGGRRLVAGAGREVIPGSEGRRRAVRRAARGVARRQPRGRGGAKGREAAPRHHGLGRLGLANAGAVDRRPAARPTGRRMAGGSRPAGATGRRQGLFKVPVAGGEPVRLVSGQAFNPAWSPKGDLIVYTTAVGGAVPMLGVRPDGRVVPLPSERVRPGGYRFLPDGTGLVYLPHNLFPDFWLLDLAGKTPRRLTHLSYRGALQDLRRHSRREAHRVRPLARELEHRPDRSAEIGGTRSRPGPALDGRANVVRTTA